MLSVPNTKVKYWAVWVEDTNGNFGEPEILTLIGTLLVARALHAW